MSIDKTSGNIVTLTAAGLGDATVTVKAGDFQKTCKVSVLEKIQGTFYASSVDNLSGYLKNLSGEGPFDIKIVGSGITTGVVSKIRSAMQNNQTKKVNLDMSAVVGLEDMGIDALRECKGLTSITLPNGLTSIGDKDFRGCTGLKNITIPDGVTYIGNYAFYGCTGLESITINAIVPPKLDGKGEFYYSAKIYVPKNSLDAYKADASWSLYSDRIFAIEE